MWVSLLYVEETPNLNNYTNARVSFITYKDLLRYMSDLIESTRAYGIFQPAIILPHREV